MGATAGLIGYVRIQRNHIVPAKRALLLETAREICRGGHA